MRIDRFAVNALLVLAASSCIDAFVVLQTTRRLPTQSHSTVEDEQQQKQQEEDLDWRRQDLFGTTLIDQTMQELQDPERVQQQQTQLLTKEERAARRRALDTLGIPSFSSFLAEKTDSVPTIHRPSAPTVLQINIGLYCNQACSHCHVESSPLLTDSMMTAETAAQCLRLLAQSPSITTLDITGGAPELNDNFRYLVATARAQHPDLEIIDRCNLTVLQEPGQEDLIDFLKEHRVRIVASLPCYSSENVDQQRGSGVFSRSIAGLLALNDAGYGKSDKHPLDLVYNPGGAFLPPPQATLQEAYTKELHDTFGIEFDHLFTMTNMPIKRFADYLHRKKELTDYMQLLVDNFNPETLTSLMCKDTVSVSYDGKIFDCDFNQQLGLQNSSDKKTVFDFESLDELSQQPISTDNHCFGCTAGMGSS